MLGSTLVVYGLVEGPSLSLFPLILLGALLVVLYEFHARIDGLLGFWKFLVPIGRVKDPPASQEKPDPTELEQRRQANAKRQREAEDMDWPTRGRQRRWRASG